ncbi:MAG: hypothetical protein EBX17_03965 [Betaproteobacteria bacterium]|nr:hypothetical protein [Betaproteobacteria bacterium]NCX22337.1 hypothetical protein [Betaproteobacteria bacterium]NDE54571.1 hypothetical protein [Actinomycetota bacterium]
MTNCLGFTAGESQTDRSGCEDKSGRRQAQAMVPTDSVWPASDDLQVIKAKSSKPTLLAGRNASRLSPLH